MSCVVFKFLNGIVVNLLLLLFITACRVVPFFLDVSMLGNLAHSIVILEYLNASGLKFFNLTLCQLSAGYMPPGKFE